MIPIAEALRIVQAETRPTGSERVSISHAFGRILAEEIIADTDLPPFNRAQMDGYAVRASDVQNVPARLRIVGESAAGRGWHHEMNAGEAVRIMTGAPVPIGADSVQQVELTREKDNIVQIDEPVTLGRSIVLRGSEIRRGEKVFRAGERINAALVAVLASFGYAEVKVGCRPRVAVIATGTELVEVNKSPGQDQIRDSNNYSIEVYAALAGAQVERFPLAGDDRELLAQQISASASHCDVVVTSGGVSMGVYDFTKTALRDLGAEIFFERVALRPGKPTVFGRLPNGALVFGLPGNPVSVSVTFNLFARTALLLMQGAADPDLARESAILIRAIQGNAERDSYLPASLTTNEHGLLQAEPLKWGGSSDFIGFARADALIVIPMQTHYSAGDVVQALKLPR